MPEVRRCGIRSVFEENMIRVRLIGAFTVPPPGESHTAPAGELFAISLVSTRIKWRIAVTFVIDCKPIYNDINIIRRDGAHIDSCECLWLLVEKKELVVHVRSVKSHLDKTSFD